MNINSLCLIPKVNARAKCFLLHHAGGSISYYRDWFQEFSTEIELTILELPGRGKTFGEKLIDNYDIAVNTITKTIKELADRPYVIFGHSMGALLGFGVSEKLEKRGRPPSHLFVSGCDSPHYLREFPPPKRSAMQHSELMENLERLGGLPQEVLKSDEMISLLIPIFRADFKIVETFDNASSNVVNTPITVFSGKDDCSGISQQRWAHASNKKLKLEVFEGDHFFINQHRAKIVSIIEKSIS